uniref:lipocalin Cav p 3.0101-like n=1 Tax=Ictidomys tridecemlineatus TaxID=43179 RepID=UPI001A9FF441|nr:lipocalin Cav p 3.0101-like [Ictidomys tridecemlineatus]
MKTFLLALGFSLICASSQVDPAEVTGDWHTILMGADDLEKISEYGEMRFHYRHLDCSDGGKKIDFTFYSKSNGECQKFFVRSSKGPHDIYEVKYKGQNFFQIEYLSDGVVVFYNINVDGNGKVTHMTVLACKYK